MLSLMQTDKFVNFASILELKKTNMNFSILSLNHGKNEMIDV